MCRMLPLLLQILRRQVEVDMLVGDTGNKEKI
jgi:hypothetical protein